MFFADKNGRALLVCEQAKGCRTLIYAFGSYEFDTGRRELSGPEGSLVPVEPSVFDLLEFLIRNRDRVVSKDEILEHVWSGRIVSESTLTSRVTAARHAVGDSGSEQRFIRTVARKGLRFVAEVTETVALGPGATGSAAAQAGQTIRYAKSADGTRIAYAVSGNGPPLLRAAHQSTHLELEWNSTLFRPVFDALGAQYRLVRYDIRGSGLSDSNPVRFSIEAHLEDLIAVADAAGLDRFALLATHNSTLVAVRFAALNSDRVDRFVIQEGYVRGRALRGTAGEDPFVGLVRVGDWSNPRNAYMRAWVSLINPDLARDQATELAEILSTASRPDNFLANRSVFDVCDSSDYLPMVQAPTLVIHARNDVLNPLEEGRIIAVGIPGAEFRVVESANTLCVAGDQTLDEQCSAILEFLARDGRNS